MSDTAIRNRLNALNLNNLMAEQRKYGRLNVSPKFRQEWHEIHAYTKNLLEDDRRGLIVKKMARLLFEITFSLATVPQGSYPNYYQYTDAHLLDWFLSPELKNFSDLKHNSVLGVFFMLQDLLDFEARSVGGIEKHLRDNFDKATALRRQEVISDAVRVISELTPSPQGRDVPHLANLEEYAVQPTRLSATVHFSCMPLTQNHDEVVFIRTLHSSELCFFGIRLCLRGAIEAIKIGQIEAAAKELRDGAEIAQLLHKVLQVLRTMPIDHFAKFRDFTGKASAIQSMSYHLMDIFLRGVNTEKAEHFEKVEQLKPLLRYANPGFVSLRAALDRYAKEESHCLNLFDAARRLDRNLLTWRGLHLSFAKLYIPTGQGGTGGTTGANYLQKHLLTGLFSDTQPDYRLIQEMFPELELPGSAQVSPGMTLAPPREAID